MYIFLTSIDIVTLVYILYRLIAFKFDIVVDVDYYLVHTYFLLLFICTHSDIYFVQFTSFYFCILVYFSQNFSFPLYSM